jgi:hypothetical protein
MAVYNFASKYATKVDERFKRDALANLVTNHDYDFTGVDTVNVYTINTASLNTYKRSGANRYGTPGELGNSVQSMKVSVDKGWTFIIDKANKNQTQMVMDAGQAVSRQLDEVIIPAYDEYVFWTLAKHAGEAVVAGGVTKSNAYETFLGAQEHVGNKNVPDQGRVCLCSYKFAGLLKQDAAFMRDCDVAQNMQIKGHLGEVDGTKFVRVPSSRLPDGCDFILTHPVACVAPKQLSEYKIHTDAPGISGWLCEGRILFDAFVLKNKEDAVYYHGSKAIAETFDWSKYEEAEGEPTYA